MERIPIMIFINDSLPENSFFMSQKEKNDNKKNPVSPLTGMTVTVDRFLSGFFIVEGFSLTYDIQVGRIIPKYRLTRREWGVPQAEEVF